MGHKTERHQGAAERTVKDIRRKTRKRYSSEEKIRIVLAGLPVSTTHIAVGAVFGVGFFREYYTTNSRRRRHYLRNRKSNLPYRRVSERDQDKLRRRKLVRRSHFMGIVAAWIITVPSAASLAALIYYGAHWVR